MALPLPNLDDRSFSQIAEDARAQIPSVAPEWTDHNVHDPGITFIELFAWLAEMEQYRLNRTAVSSFLRFFSLVGVQPLGQSPAQVAVAVNLLNLPQGVFAPATSRLTPIGHETLPFETVRDTFLTNAQLKRVITSASGRETVQTNAQNDEAGHYQAFGPTPAVGDSLRLGFQNWFDQEEGHLTITLFEDDLPQARLLLKGELGFFPSAKIVWEYLAGSGWVELDVAEDNTLSFSRSGDLIFRHPHDAVEQDGYRWLRARLTAGGFEIPPRIFGIETNTIRARQVETIVNQILGKGLGTADQALALTRKPLLVTADFDDGPFQAGEVLEWEALLQTLNNASGTDERSRGIAYVARRLTDLGATLDVDGSNAADRFALAAVFDRLLDQSEFYDPRLISWVQIPDAVQEQPGVRPAEWRDRRTIRSFNRYVLQRIFPGQLISDRVEIETGVITTGDEADDWTSWLVVEGFADSGPQDRHCRVDANSGIVLFGNGLNGCVPQSTELIRARFYRHSLGAAGNLSAGQNWLLVARPGDTTVELRGANSQTAAGGRDPQPLDDSKDEARAAFRKQYPMVTAKDYEERARATPGLRIAHVKALPNFSPIVPCLKLPGDVTVIVVPAPPPAESFPDAPPPAPTQGFRQTVQSYLDQQRAVTTNIHVIGPVYVPVAVRCRVFLRRRAAAAEARSSIDQTLKRFLDPVTGGPGPGKGWQFGRSVFPSEILQQLAKLPTVDYVTCVALNALKVGQSLPLPYNGLPRSARHAIELVPFELRSQIGSNCEDEDL